jgi:hypothetical protein
LLEFSDLRILVLGGLFVVEFLFFRKHLFNKIELLDQAQEQSSVHVKINILSTIMLFLIHCEFKNSLFSSETMIITIVSISFATFLAFFSVKSYEPEEMNTLLHSKVSFALSGVISVLSLSFLFIENSLFLFLVLTIPYLLVVIGMLRNTQRSSHGFIIYAWTLSFFIFLISNGDFTLFHYLKVWHILVSVLILSITILIIVIRWLPLKPIDDE